MSHCKCSEIYRNTRIPQHEVQFRSSLMVKMYLSNRYKKAYERHKDLLERAIQHLEKRLHS